MLLNVSSLCISLVYKNAATKIMSSKINCFIIIKRQKKKVTTVYTVFNGICLVRYLG